MEGLTMQWLKEQGQKDKQYHKPHSTLCAYLGAPEG